MIWNLDAEWDLERALEKNATTLTAVGAGLALLVDRRFAPLPLVVVGFSLWHAVEGWWSPHRQADAALVAARN